MRDIRIHKENKGGIFMTIELANVFDEYSKPFFIIKPILVFEGGCKQPTEDFEYIYVNPAFCSFLGRKKEELEGHRYLENYNYREKIWMDLFSNYAKQEAHTYVENISTVINKILYTEVFHIAPDLCGCIVHKSRRLADIEEAEKEMKLWQQAHVDCMTGFYNRYCLQKIIDDKTKKENLGITFLDINGLKEVNDTMGHNAGDSLIIKVSDMIRDCYKNSVVFRVGGDEFVILTTGMERDSFLVLSEKNQNAFKECNLAAIGYQYYDNVKNLSDCIDECDSLMYINKREMKLQNS